MRRLIPKRIVVVESPYAGDVAANLQYARACLKDCIARGEAPFASHLLFTQPGVLDDTVHHERELGIQCGFAWGDLADSHIIYTDMGISAGMAQAIKRAKSLGQLVEYRTLEKIDA